MKNLFVTLLLLAGAACFGQVSDLRVPRSGYIQLTATCSNANTSCDGATTVFGEQGTVLGPQTLEFNTLSYGLAVIYISGNSTASGSTISFEFSDDGGTDWYQNSCTRTDTNQQLNTDSPPGSTYRAYECSVGAATRGRVRQTAISSGTLLISATLTAGVIEPAPTFQMSTTGTAGSNPCVNPHANIQSVSFTTSGTTAVQEIALSGTTKVYGCSLNVVGQSGTTPTFSLVFGTGSNCGTGQGTLVPAFATPANTLFPFVSPIFITTAGQAVCYLDTGTTPVQVVTLTFVQQ